MMCLHHVEYAYGSSNLPPTFHKQQLFFPWDSPATVLNQKEAWGSCFELKESLMTQRQLALCKVTHCAGIPFITRMVVSISGMDITFTIKRVFDIIAVPAVIESPKAPIISISPGLKRKYFVALVSWAIVVDVKATKTNNLTANISTNAVFNLEYYGREEELEAVAASSYNYNNIEQGNVAFKLWGEIGWQKVKSMLFLSSNIMIMTLDTAIELCTSMLYKRCHIKAGKNVKHYSNGNINNKLYYSRTVVTIENTTKIQQIKINYLKEIPKKSKQL
ncbi:hypothetical protein FF38_00064 [Lucilia cuprina]|uniref:Uncharacterized protein n=1 Tax=Lucilia cuprina TaxID=7375 RepID=A0A0L0BX37_LUCCU|nr:hypothetical protein FF38_00064 [Lucilia cuprina]